MSFQQLVEQHHKLQFTDAMEHALQQHGGILRPFVSEMDGKGELTELTKIFGEANPVQVPERRRTNIDNPLQRNRRWVGQPIPWGDGCVLDKVDKWNMCFDPTSELNVAYAQGMKRREDQIILEGMVGSTTLEGKYGGNPVPLPDGNVIDGTVGSGDNATPTGLNPKKLRAARVKIKKVYGDMPMPEMYIAVSAQQIDDMLAFPEVTSADFFNPPGGQPLATGAIGRWLDFTFIDFQSTRFTEVGSVTYRECPIWTKDGVKLVIWEDHWSDLKNDTSLHASPPVTECGMAMVAGRPQDGRVHKILCKEPDGT